VTPEHWRRVEEAFAAASDVAADRRPAVLAESCGADHALRAEVEALLAAADDGDGAARLRDLIGAEADALVAPGELRGRRLGAYRVVDELGEGGMGAVYLAVRDDDQYRTRVAIKLLQRGLDSPHAVARFRDERQILAGLDHPGIVRLLDGGSTDDGLPFLVMEHLEGVPITEHAELRGATVRARVELFLQVCAAVEYAHRQLVVHRDLKPTNILVTDGGTAKLLDFGIAKLLGDQLEREAARTQTGMHLLTPQYASPEQARGEPASTASDVYSLGAVLYELLTGAPAVRIEGTGLAALQAILDVEPARPSVVAPASRRRALAGDLDNIVLAALRKEPARRYRSVEALSLDLRRYLDGRPVEARPGTWSYRAGKFLRRHRLPVAVAAAGLGLVAVVGALYVLRIVDARRAAERSVVEVERARRQTVTRNHELILLQARDRLDRDPTASLAWL
jgi:serine/threonine protein kinase